MSEDQAAKGRTTLGGHKNRDDIRSLPERDVPPLWFVR
jgi:hypothetical protein